MCQTLFYIPYQIHGVPIFGIGILLAFWFTTSVILIMRLVRRHGWDGETRSHILPLVLVGAAIWFLPRLFPGGLPIRGYGVMLLLGAVAGVGLAVYRARQMGLDADLIFSLAFWMFVPGIVGARLFHVIEYWESDYRHESMLDTFKAVVNVPGGGLVVYGSLIGAGIGFVAFIRKDDLPGLAIADLVAPCLALGLALGRLGCLLNGCCYGGLCDRPWAVTFPPGSPPYQSQVARGQMMGFDLGTDFDAAPRVLRVAEGSVADQLGLRAGDRFVRINGRRVKTAGQVQSVLMSVYDEGVGFSVETSDGRQHQLPAVPARRRSLPVHATQIYSAVAALLLSLFLWSYYPFRRRDGEVVALMLSIYPVQRVLLEMIRRDEPAVFRTGLSISQNISLLMLVGVVIFWGYVWRRPRGSALPVETR